MSLSNYSSQAILNALFGKTSNFGALATRPTIFVGLSTTTPTSTGGNVTEPSGGGYSRVPTAPGDWDAATLADPSVVTNSEPVEFPQATADWLAQSNFTHLVLYDAVTGGAFLGAGALTGPPKNVKLGDTAVFDPGSLQVTLT